jgi:hypothetical protein
LRTMTKRKRKKKRFDPFFPFFRHPLSPFHHPTIVRLTIVFLGFFCLAGATLAYGPASGAQSSSSSHAHDFLIFTTVFTDQGFALPGAHARVRRPTDKKFRWEAESDRRGEFAIRVPQNAEYEMTIEAHGFKTQVRKIDARDDNRADLTIRMEPVSEPHDPPSAGGKS